MMFLILWTVGGLFLILNTDDEVVESLSTTQRFILVLAAGPVSFSMFVKNLITETYKRIVK